MHNQGTSSQWISTNGSVYCSYYLEEVFNFFLVLSQIFSACLHGWWRCGSWEDLDQRTCFLITTSSVIFHHLKLQSMKMKEKSLLLKIARGDGAEGRAEMLSWEQHISIIILHRLKARRCLEQRQLPFSITGLAADVSGPVAFGHLVADINTGNVEAGKEILP